MAVDARTLDDIAEKIAAGLKMLGGVKMGAEAQIQSVVESALAHFDVVTHERMEVQEAMLRKAREDLQAMEARIASLEAQLKK
ncbi:MAG: 3-octaprenyl-4-hydroxybenzoate carboxy-lyase [Zetaproteobacteria bacterium CG2_30_46_52]|nr:MAG: 3-octaprenyl-4-hydroxybenzoate carboxy-lyase [Zetaproteobacteria bacterium CG2_30_46_52]